MKIDITPRNRKFLTKIRLNRFVKKRFYGNVSREMRNDLNFKYFTRYFKNENKQESATKNEKWSKTPPKFLPFFRV